MEIFGLTIGKTKQDSPQIEARSGMSRPMFSVSYDGEKTPDGLGDLIKYDLDYHGLRLRSWESYLTSPTTQTVVKKFALWVIGSGLKLQSEPIESILKGKNINIDVNEFTKSVESRFRVYSKSKLSDYSEIKTLNKLANTAYINSIIGGDVLIVLRYENNNLNVQLIDGANIVSPYWDDELGKAKKRGNKIKNGIEIDKRGRHVAFHVKVDTFKSTRILAKSKKGDREMAFLVCGLEYRLADNRGLPLFSAVLETITKIERYRDAIVDGAEERQKVPFFIEHDLGSTGESPMAKNAAKAFNVDAKQEIATDVTGKQLADNVSVSMSKQVYNLPQGATMKAIESKAETNFESFYTPNVNSVCSTIGIPPDVAFSKYDSNYSASRAAIKDWEHTLNVARKDFSTQFYEKIYEFWLDMQMLENNITSNGYINALGTNDRLILAAFRNARFVGANVPHIDPVKEVNAERLKLGKSGASIPLTTAEAATEALNGGDYESNVTKYAEELKLSIEKKVIEPVKEVKPIKKEE